MHMFMYYHFLKHVYGLTLCCAIKTGPSVGAATALFLSVALILHCKRKRSSSKQGSLSSNRLISNLPFEPQHYIDPELCSTDYKTHIFSYAELHEATDGFSSSQELGAGGFGTVYKGQLRDGRTVAVKRLYEANCRQAEQFMNEVDILSHLRHQNLVSLYGCTSRRCRQLLLVYEFMPNGTVADHLHGPRACERRLTWPLRMRIAVETADALAYLHSVAPPIVHRDVKTKNILLDADFHVKVADFGLSRLFPTDATHVSTAPQGTPGYVDPEYHACFRLTDKSDVYSFGVVLVELVSSKLAVDLGRCRDEIILANMAIDRIQRRELAQLADPALGYDSDRATRKMITVVAELAFRCLQRDREMRPSIKEVLEVLRGIEDGACEMGKEEEGNVNVGGGAGDDAGLLKNSAAFSPDSVTHKWVSRSTTPNTSA
uniref:Protein kinase domain-containing protein n=1 Tax=Ananas comosus var. bracteatus TaxID=296719 RepID=A0A6V7PVU0_ANACO|nr:unnamed protein product [Ananas comosus var. bracteatus]